MSEREQIEAAADKVAELLGIDPEDVGISAPAGKVPHVMLTVAQINALLERVR